MKNAIEVENVKKTFKNHTALHNINMQIPEGSIYGFIGKNGAGKTTTLSIMLGILPLTSGHIRIFGQDTQELGYRATQSIGALIDAKSTYPHLSGWDNLDITRRLLKLEEAEIDRVLDVVDLKTSAQRKVGQYSLGMKQRLGIARALLGKPRILILDEPLNGLDPDGILDMRRLIRQLALEEGMSILVSSHLLSEVQQIATHVGLIHEGQMRAEGRLDDLLSHAGTKVALRTNDLTRSHHLVSTLGYQSTVQEDQLDIHLDPGRSQDMEIAAINSTLVGAGIAVFELTQTGPSLEALYQSRTRNPSPC